MNAVNQELVDTLVEQVNEFAKAQKEYNLSSESAYHALCSDLGYGNPDESQLEDHAKTALKVLRKRFPKTWKSELLKYTHVEQTGIHIQDNEIFSVSPGEVEEQMPDELVAALSKLSNEEYELVRRHADVYLQKRGQSCPDCIYLNLDYNRFVLILDTDALCAEMNVEVCCE